METTDIENMSALLQAYANINADDIGGEAASDSEFPVYADEVGAFFQIIAQDYWTDLQYDPAGEEQRIGDDAYIQQADLSQIKSMLTYCLRAERFAGGSWQTLFENGSLAKIIQRVEQIKQENS